MDQETRNKPEVSFGTSDVNKRDDFVLVKGKAPCELELRVYFNHYWGFGNTSTLICGEKEAILVSASFLLSDAYRIAAGILESGRKLTHILVPEYHPDHFFSAGALKDLFPETRIVALESVVRDIRGWLFGDHTNLPLSEEYRVSDKNGLWANVFGPNIPNKPCVPEVLSQPRLELEGHAIELVDHWNGDTDNETLVLIPAMRAAIASDIAIWKSHPWTIESDHARRQAWIADLERLRAMNLDILIPGHAPSDDFTSDPNQIVDFMIGYLNDFDRALEGATTGDEMVTYLERKYPNMDILRYSMHWQAQIAFPGTCSDKVRPIPGVMG